VTGEEQEKARPFHRPMTLLWQRTATVPARACQVKCSDRTSASAHPATGRRIAARPGLCHFLLQWHTPLRDATS
jgi:hypothetical protein